MARTPILPNEIELSALSIPADAMPLDIADLELIEAARAVIRLHHRPFWHTVAAAMRAADGRIWTGLHLGTTVGRLAICAEPVALGRAILDGPGLDGSLRIITVVAVRHAKPEEQDQDIAVVTPCGACRELLADYAPHCLVIVPGALKMSVARLLPLPYRR